MRRQRLQFRNDEVRYLLKRWNAGESCAIVGVGSIGKSNLLQHLLTPEVQQHHLGASAKTLLIINIDPALLAPLPKDVDLQMRCWAGYELMLHRLYLALYPLDVLETDAARFYETYQALQDGTNSLLGYMGIRYFELALEFLFRREFRIVFLFDEYEEMIQQLPAKFFQTMRGLRDTHKSQLMFGTFSRQTPENLAAQYRNTNDMEPFLELINDNVLYVGPYSLGDARDMLQNLAKREQQNILSAEWLEFILNITGRYAGLMRATFRAALSLTQTHTVVHEGNRTELLRKILLRPSVWAECETIWKSLSKAEKTVASILVRGQNYSRLQEFDSAISLLTQKRIIVVIDNSTSLVVHPPLLEAFIKTRAETT